MAYVADGRIKKEVPPLPYQKYNVPVCDFIDDSEENIVVFPELFLFTLASIVKAQRLLWWMSVDNALGDESDFAYAFSEKNIIHLSQSQYSTEYLISNGVDARRIHWLCDYINSDFLHLKKIADEDRKNVVVYNPKKGFETTSKLIEKAGNRINWLPLEGYTATGVRNILQSSKVYIDFGNHPGRDRIPREAAYCGCCILTNRKGSADNSIDIPIEEKFKISQGTPINEIIEIILSFINNYSNEKLRFNKYNERTEEEFRMFEVDALSIFEKLLGPIIDEKEENALKELISTCVTNGKYKEAITSIVKYRQQGYKEDVEMAIFEVIARTEILELNEAEYVARKTLNVFENNYELILLLARIHLLMNTIESLKECLYECTKAIKLSKGTEDEPLVVQMAECFINDVKNIIEKK